MQMMKTWLVAFIVPCFLIACMGGNKETVDVSTTLIEKTSLHSTVLDEERSYWVQLPQSYDDTTYAPKNYPVLYLLDADSHFSLASSMVAFLSDGTDGNMQIPELIIVGIPSTARTRDLTPTQMTTDFMGKPTGTQGGGADKFLSFIETELAPAIEQKYRTSPYRVLAGHSLGGAFVVHSMLKDTPFFQGYIATDPSLWWDDGLLISKAKNVFATVNSLHASLYMSLSGISEVLYKSHIDRVQSFARLTEKSTLEGFTSRFQVFPEETHGSIPLLSLYNGLMTLFTGHAPNTDSFLSNPDDWPRHIEEQYDSFSKRLGFQYLPPEALVDMVAVYALEENPNKALELAKLNSANYPSSLHATRRLAEAYVKVGLDGLAKATYGKVQ